MKRYFFAALAVLLAAVSVCGCGKGGGHLFPGGNADVQPGGNTGFEPDDGLETPYKEYAKFVAENESNYGGIGFDETGVPVYAEGVCYLNLVDLDGDGTDELVSVTREPGRSEIQDYVLEIFALCPEGVRRVYVAAPYIEGVDDITVELWRHEESGLVYVRVMDELFGDWRLVSSVGGDVDVCTFRAGTTAECNNDERVAGDEKYVVISSFNLNCFNPDGQELYEWEEQLRQFTEDARAELCLGEREA